MEILDTELTKDILERLPDWKKAITPSGELASQPCFIQKNIPNIIPFTKDQTMAHLVTHSLWTQRLVDYGVLWDHHNDTTLQSLAMAQLLFYPHQHASHPLQLAHKQFHMLYYETCAWFSLNHILRPTIAFKQAILHALQPYATDDYSQVLKNLNQVFHLFGFLWPQKIILGYKIHVKKSYKALTDDERLMQLRVAKDDAFMMLSKERDIHLKSRQKDLSLEEECLTWSIIKRNDVCPIYEFLDEPYKQQIKEVINICFYRIPIHAPIKLCNYATKTYLSWRRNNKLDVLLKKNKIKQSQQQQLKQQKPFLIGALPLDQMNETSSQYLWRFTWTPSRAVIPSYTALPDLVASYQPQFIKCNSSVYLSPACDTFINNKDDNNNHILSTHAMILSRSLKGDSRTRSIDLFDIENHPLDRDDNKQDEKDGDQKNGDEKEDKHNLPLDISTFSWKIELPGLGLGRDDDSSTDEGLNMDILIGRRRPIIHQDLIALRQILYLCALPNKDTKNNNSNNSNNNDSNNNSNNNSNKNDQQNNTTSTFHQNTPHGILAKENSIVTNKLEQCWSIELPSDIDLKYHQPYFVHWPPDFNNNNINEIKRRKSEESLRSTTPTLRRVQSLKHYHYKQNNNNNNNNNNNSNNSKSVPMDGKDNQHGLFIQSNLESTSSITLVTSPNSQLLKRSSSFDSPSKLSLIIEEDEKKSMSTTATTTTTRNNNQEPIKTSQSLNLPKEKNDDQMLSKNKWNTIGNTPLQRSLAYFSTEASPSPPLHPSLQIPIAPTLNHLDHYQIGHVNSSTISLQNQHNYNHHQNPSSTYIVSAPSSLSQQQNNHQLLTSISIHDQLNDELGFDTNIATSTDQIQPYLRLYASKQNSKTLSHIWKNSSLKFLRKNKK